LPTWTNSVTASFAGTLSYGPNPAFVSNDGFLSAQGPNEKAAATTGDPGFEEFFEATMKESIRDLLGESSMLAIMYHLKMDSPVRDPALFHKRLYELLRGPAQIVEEMIVKDLFKKLNVLYAPKGTFEFVRYYNSAKEVYTSRGKKRGG
jgi:hypothetical protein